MLIDLLADVDRGPSLQLSRTVLVDFLSDGDRTVDGPDIRDGVLVESLVDGDIALSHDRDIRMLIDLLANVDRGPGLQLGRTAPVDFLPDVDGSGDGLE